MHGLDKGSILALLYLGRSTHFKFVKRHHYETRAPLETHSIDAILTYTDARGLKMLLRYIALHSSTSSSTSKHWHWCVSTVRQPTSQGAKFFNPLFRICRILICHAYVVALRQTQPRSENSIAHPCGLKRGMPRCGSRGCFEMERGVHCGRPVRPAGKGPLTWIEPSEGALPSA